MRGVKEERIRWCCGTFRQHYEEAGTPGVAILPFRRQGVAIGWVLQARAAETAAAEAAEPSQGVRLDWAIFETPVGYCPWCGMDLRKWYWFADDLMRDDVMVLTAEVYRSQQRAQE